MATLLQRLPLPALTLVDKLVISGAIGGFTALCLYGDQLDDYSWKKYEPELDIVQEKSWKESLFVKARTGDILNFAHGYFSFNVCSNSFNPKISRNFGVFSL